MIDKIKKINPKSLRIPTKAYSQGVLVPMGNAELLFITGQLPQDLEGNVVAPNDAKTQTELVFHRISEILKEAGMNMKDIIKVQIFVKDIKDVKVISHIRDKFLKDIRPASLMVEVSDFVKENCCVEIEAIAYKIDKK